MPNPPGGTPALPGDALSRNPEAMADTHRYALDIAAWLGKAGLAPEAYRQRLVWARSRSSSPRPLITALTM
ncbi:MAG: hypothetical protein JWO83_4921 [Caulobacteraceae bacterium]|nr:hypothetical protein [Caulobacteraceae bacterium]